MDHPRAPSAPAVTGILLLSLLAMGAPAPLAGQEARCPERAGPHAEAGWAAYGDGDMSEARTRFTAALALCPGDAYASTGLGYVALREGREEEARRLLEGVVARTPGSVDALTGLGILAWRAGELEEVLRRFRQVEELDPGNATAVDYLSRLPRGIGPPPARPPLELPDTLRYPARTAGDGFQVRGPGGWEPFHWKGVNLGAALPGRHPSQFPDSVVYAGWIREMAEMNANLVRVYTIHPPHFYQALLEWNTRNPDRPLWLVHGVWTELPEDHDFQGRDFQGEFFAEMRRVVDLVHGRADIAPRPGHASGFYTADVSEWTLAWIIGREWEPYSALAYDSLRGGESGFQGRYLTVEGGNAMEAWLGRAMEEMIAYETETYRAQRPMAYTNWPTLDPLTHPTETTVDEEMAIRLARGERPAVRPNEYDNDALGLDAARVRPTPRFPAGSFASFHAYPYYPDFMILSPALERARSSFGPSNYFGYLQALKAHHRDQPVVISEYGVPASLGVAHLQPQGWHHGGLTEEEMAAINRRLTLEMAEAGLAGGALFAWIDEWFKKNWVALEFELPPDRNRLWYNRLDAEQHYGMLAVEARPPVAGATLRERLQGWREVEPVAGGDGITLRAAHDAAYLWLLVETPARMRGDTLFVGFDMLDPTAGDVRWPGATGPLLPVGVEFVLRDGGGRVQVMADPPSNPFRLEPVGAGASGLEGGTVETANPPAGFFTARSEQRFNLPFYTEHNDDGVYEPLRVLVNRRRFTRDSTEYLAMGYDRGVLPGGPPPDGFWERSSDGTALEVRIPWLLLNVTDPSSRSVLAGPGDANVGNARRNLLGRWEPAVQGAAWPDSVFGEFEIRSVEDLGLVAGLRTASGRWAGDAVAGRFTWPVWEEPEWTSRRRPVYKVMAETFASLTPGGVAPVGATPGAEARAGSAPGEGGAPSGAGGGQEDPAARAWREGDTDRARELYRARLDADPRDATALHRLALLRAWEEDHDDALTLLDRLLEVEPGNTEARVDRARITAWKGDVDGALAQLDRLLEDDPALVPALEARALFQAWAGRYDASLTTYDALLGIAPDNAEARRSQARVLSWAERFQASRAVYDSLLAADPGDTEARLGLARVLAFADELEEAETQYGTILEDHPGNIPALQGLARTRGWAGRLVEAEATWRLALELDPTGVDTRVGLARTLRWQGRNAAALELLEESRRLDPLHGEMREELRSVRVALGERVGPSFTVEEDSDDNRMITSALTARFHPHPRLGIRADGYRRDLRQNALERTAWGATATVSWQFEPGWTLSAGGGGSRSDADGASTLSAWHLGVVTPGRYRLGASLTASSSALDATALLADREVRVREVALNGRWTPAPGWRVDGSLGHALFRSAVDNRRLNGALSASRGVGGGWTVGAGIRAFGFRDDLQEGYFDPDLYGIAEGTVRWLREGGAWNLLLEAAPGVQQVTRDGDPAGAFRGSGRLGFILGPGREISLSAGYSSAGLQSFSTGDSDYRYTAFILGGSWAF